MHPVVWVKRNDRTILDKIDGRGCPERFLKCTCIVDFKNCITEQCGIECITRVAVLVSVSENVTAGNGNFTESL